MIRAVIIGLYATRIVSGLSLNMVRKGDQKDEPLEMWAREEVDMLEEHSFDHDQHEHDKHEHDKHHKSEKDKEHHAEKEKALHAEKAALCAWHNRTGIPVKQTLHADETGMAYYGTVTVGGQTVSAVYDTGSWDNVILSSCKFHSPGTHEQCCAHNKCPYAGYASHHSKCFHKDPGEMEKLIFGSGTTWVKNGHDTLSIHSAIENASSLDIPKFPLKVVVDSNMHLFEVANHLQSIFGIGMEATKPGMPLDIMEVRRFMMCFDADPLKDGVIFWNDEDRINQPQWKAIDVIGDGVDWWSGFWVTETKGWKVQGPGKGKKADSIGCENGCAAIVDSGTTMMTAPRELVDQIEEAVGDLEDCSDLSKFPTVRFTLGDQEFTLPPESYIAEADGQYDLQAKPEELALPMLPLTAEDRRLHLEAKAQGKRAEVRACALLFEAESRPEKTPWGPLLIVGMPMLRKYAIQFDTGVKPAKMRFAEADAHCTSYGSKHEMQFSVSDDTSGHVHQDRWTQDRFKGKIQLPKWHPKKHEHLTFKFRKKHAKARHAARQQHKMSRHA
jgi:hypothetical protein